jgi:CxxC motif-containing protein (DUF1111 family)
LTRTKVLLLVALSLLLITPVAGLWADSPARDPGLRTGGAGAGDQLSGLSTGQQNLFQAGQDDFKQRDTIGSGLGPRFNLDSCAGCHLQPAIGGTSPALNPQVKVATDFGARNTVPYFVLPNGPVREARFKYNADGTRDGGVHALFVISGRKDATGDASKCTITQENFWAQGQNNNIIFRIPTPTFGAGLIEAIPDDAITDNQTANANGKAALGIVGRPHRLRVTGATNNNGNDGTIARFGWKAQNKSLLLFAAEAYNVEIGISNELFPQERDETPTCQFARTPNDTTNPDGTTAADTLSDIEKFAFFMRFLAPPIPVLSFPDVTAASITAGRALFQSTGCAYCHTPTLYTGDSAIAALRKKPVNLYSDLLVHQMGPGLADDIIQGQAGPDEFRSAPLWGLGQRIFFLHDGRTSDLLVAIRAHKSAGNNRFQASEANAVIDKFNQLSEAQKQDLVNFLRSL